MTSAAGSEAALSSLAAQEAALARIIGKDAAAAAVDAWRTAQSARIDDAAFAARFSAHFDRFDAPTTAYAHRVVDLAPGARALGGVRFYGGDARRAFVEICAWDEAAGVERLAATAAAEWRDFKPFALRLLTPATAPPEGGVLDQTIHAARVAEMTAPRGGVALEPLDAPAEAARMAAARYAAVEDVDPELRSEMSPLGAAAIAESAANGAARWIVADGRRVGFMCLAPGAAAFVAGLEVSEIVVALSEAGRGFASEAQRRLAAELADRAPDTVILGTVHRLNAASRRSAERAGRPARLAYFFVPLPRP